MTLPTLRVLDRPRHHDRPEASEGASKKRRYRPRDVLAMTSRYVLLVRESEDLENQLCAIHLCVLGCTELGLNVSHSLQQLGNHKMIRC